VSPTRDTLGDGWERLTSPSRGKLGQVWRHVASGWIVEHCGHPTALWPWSARAPDRLDEMVLARTGFA
jgi:hypothetical protein